jgi:SAM-dependent methyltransferase
VTTAPDGSPIDLYLRLPSFGEAERIHELIPAGADVLELGCGVGRVTRQLVRLGHPVTAVDESDDMLMHVRGAEVVRARIEELDLGRRFACVLLMSRLVNVPDGEQCRAFLRVCARHVAEDGAVLIERHEPDWQPAEGHRGERDGVAVTLEHVRVDGPSVAATVRYEADGKTWLHPFLARVLDDEELDRELALAGLRRSRILGDRRTWVEARPSQTEQAKLA